MADLPLSVRRIVTACEALNFTIHEASNRRLIAYQTDLRAGLDAAWTPTATGASFESALIRDPVGQPRELYFEYKPIKVYPGKDKSGRVAETQESFALRVRLSEEAAASMNSEYNDGATIIENQWIVDSTTGIHTWLNDLMDVLGVDAKRLPIPKPRQAKQDRSAAAMLAGEEIQL